MVKAGGTVPSALTVDYFWKKQLGRIIIGKPNNLFDPARKATRGEASTILRRFAELVIDQI